MEGDFVFVFVSAAIIFQLDNSSYLFAETRQSFHAQVKPSLVLARLRIVIAVSGGSSKGCRWFSPCKWLVDRNITPHVPVLDKPTRPGGTFSRADFVFDHCTIDRVAREPLGPQIEAAFYTIHHDLGDGNLHVLRFA
jgi:hypothetical protein